MTEGVGPVHEAKDGEDLDDIIGLVEPAPSAPVARQTLPEAIGVPEGTDDIGEGNPSTTGGSVVLPEATRPGSVLVGDRPNSAPPEGDPARSRGSALPRAIQGLRHRPLVGALLILALLIPVAGVVTFQTFVGPKRPPTPFVQADAEAMAFDRRSGVLYIADRRGHRIYQLTPSGKVVPFAGTGERGFSGDGDQAIQATLDGPAGLAVDGQGNLFIADQANGRVRRVQPDGIIRTVAGAGVAATPADGNQATASKLDSPNAVAVDRQQNLIIAETGTQRVRRVGADGRVVTVAGGGAKAVGEAVRAAEAKLPEVTAVTVDAAGDLVLSTVSHQLLRVTSDGRLVVVAGNGVSGLSGDGGPADKAQLASPAGIAVDSRGQIFVADQLNSRIRRIGTDGQITTVAGGGTREAASGGGSVKATEVRLNASPALAVDDRDNVLIADPEQGQIRKLSRSGRITTLAKTPTLQPSPPPPAPMTVPSTTATTTPFFGKVFEDSFTNKNAGWPISEAASGKSEYADGGYRLTVPKGGNGIRRTAPLGTLLTPIGNIPGDALTIEAKVTFVPASPYVYAGLYCRGKANDYQGYQAQLRGDGNWAILRFDTAGQNGKPLKVPKDSSEWASTINPDGPNQLRLDCIGGADGGPVALTFAVNGQKLAEWQDVDGLPPGQVAVGASLTSSSRTETASVIYDDFVVTRQR